MSHTAPRRDAPTMVLRVSLPAGSDFQVVAAEMAVKVAEYLGQSPDNAKAAREMIESLAEEVGASASAHQDVTFEFHQVDDEMRIEARCADRSSIARCPLPT